VLRSNSKQAVWGINVVHPEEEKVRAVVGRICRKGMF